MILGCTGLFVWKKDFFMSLFTTPKTITNPETERKLAEELERDQKMSIADDAYYVALALVRNSVKNRESFVIVDFVTSFTRLGWSKELDKKGRFVQVLVKYQFKDASGKTITESKCMNFDKKLNFLGEGR